MTIIERESLHLVSKVSDSEADYPYETECLECGQRLILCDRHWEGKSGTVMGVVMMDYVRTGLATDDKDEWEEPIYGGLTPCGSQRL